MYTLFQLLQCHNSFYKHLGGIMPRHRCNFPFTLTVYDVCCVAEPVARMAFALQSRPVTGPQLGPVPYYNTSWNTGYCGLFPSSTATVNDVTISTKQHPMCGEC